MSDYEDFCREFKIETYVRMSLKDPRSIFSLSGVLEAVEREAIPDLTPLIPRSMRRELERFRRWKVLQECYQLINSLDALDTGFDV